VCFDWLIGWLIDWLIELKIGIPVTSAPRRNSYQCWFFYTSFRYPVTSPYGTDRRTGRTRIAAYWSSHTISYGNYWHHNLSHNPQWMCVFRHVCQFRDRRDVSAWKRRPTECAQLPRDSDGRQVGQCDVDVEWSDESTRSWHLHHHRQYLCLFRLFFAFPHTNIIL